MIDDWSRHSILSQSRMPLYEKYITVIYELGLAHKEKLRKPYESAAAPTAHSAANQTSKPNQTNQTDLNAALLPYLTHQFIRSRMNGWRLELA